MPPPPSISLVLNVGLGNRGNSTDILTHEALPDRILFQQEQGAGNLAILVSQSLVPVGIAFPKTTAGGPEQGRTCRFIGLDLSPGDVFFQSQQEWRAVPQGNGGVHL